MNILEKIKMVKDFANSVYEIIELLDSDNYDKIKPYIFKMIKIFGKSIKGEY